MEKIQFEMKKMRLLTTKQSNSYKNAKACCISKNNVNINMLKIKTIENLGTIVIITDNIELLHVPYVI